MKISYKDKQIELIDRGINLIAARNGFGKTRTTKSIVERWTEDVISVGAFSFFDHEKSNLPIYFSFDSLEKEENGFNFNFTEMFEKENSEELNRMIANYQISADKINDFKEVLSFRYFVGYPHMWKTWNSIRYIEKWAIDIFDKYGVEFIDSLHNYIIEKFGEIKQPIKSYDYDYNKNKFWDFNYLSSSYFLKYIDEYKFSNNENYFEIIKEMFSGIEYYGPYVGLLYMLIYIEKFRVTILHLNGKPWGSGEYFHSTKGMNLNNFFKTVNEKVKNMNISNLMISSNGLNYLSKDFFVILRNEEETDVETLSKSEKYRISLAVLFTLIEFMKDSSKSTLFLDDPFDSLDSDNFTYIMPMITKLKNKIIITTHKMDTYHKMSNYSKNTLNILFLDELFVLNSFEDITVKSVRKYLYENEINTKGAALFFRRYSEQTNGNVSTKMEDEIYSIDTDISWYYKAFDNNDRICFNEEICKKIISIYDKVANFKHNKDKTVEMLVDMQEKLKVGKDKKTIKNKIESMFKFGANNKPLWWKDDFVTYENVSEIADNYFHNKTLINDLSHYNENSLANTILINITAIEDLQKKMKDFISVLEPSFL